MRFDLEAMRAAPGRPFQLSGEVTIPDLEWQGIALRLDVPVRVSATASYQEGEVVLRVRVQGRVRRTCARCLTELVEDLDHDDLLEVLPSEIQGPFLTLRPFIEAGLRLSVVLKPLCRPDCRGICAECGADLNRVPHRAGCQVETNRLGPGLRKLRDLLGEVPPAEDSEA
ncbi:TPA: hypothetical protein DCY67_02130 [Candidatus Acetothermia bacterium]|nr:hypothetical protein [Candidatus Acetothermia bacterium]